MVSALHPVSRILWTGLGITDNDRSQMIHTLVISFVWFYVAIFFRKETVRFYVLALSPYVRATENLAKSYWTLFLCRKLTREIPRNCTCTFAGIHRSLQKRESDGDGRGSASGKDDKLSWHLWPVLRLHDVLREATQVVHISETVQRPHFQKPQRKARESKTSTLGLWRVFQFICTWRLNGEKSKRWNRSML
jgi:hypothetical protein